MWHVMVPKMKRNPWITRGEVAIHEAAIRDLESMLGVSTAPVRAGDLTDG